MPEDNEHPESQGSTGEPTARTPSTRSDGDSTEDNSQERTRPGLRAPGTGNAPRGESVQQSQSEQPQGEQSRGERPRDEQPLDRQQQDDESDPERTQTIPVVYANPASGESDPEQTQSIPAVTETFTPAARTTDTPAAQAADPPTAQASDFTSAGHTMVFGDIAQPQGAASGQQPYGEVAFDRSGTDSSASDKPAKNRRKLVRAGVAAGIAAGLLLLLYIGDLALSSGEVPRGTVVAGVSVGGMEKAAAERKLRAELGPNLNDPVKLRVGKATASIDPESAGLSMDWSATLAKVGAQPLNPITRLTSFFTTHEVTPVSNVNRDELTAALQRVKSELHRDPVEGTIRFEGADPVAVMPVTGRDVDVKQAVDVVVAKWAGDDPVRLPYSTQPVSTTPEGVRKALKQVAEPAVSQPVTVVGDGMMATLTPEEIARSLRFEPDGEGGLKWHVDVPTATKAVKPELKPTLKPGKNATFVIKGGKPVVRPSVKGRGVDWKKTFSPLRKVLVQPGPSSVRAVYEERPAEFTTKEAKSLGIREKVSTFTTKGFSHDSGVNIRRVAQEVNGAIVKPGETFSLNGYTGIRQKPQGYIASGIIKNGRPAEAVGGGISQFATTLFNAAYFAGMKDVEHQEHSYYISRYPLGREATVFQQKDGTSIIDVKFKNVSDSGILIKTRWTPKSITVTFWGTKQFKVETKHSKKSNFTNPKTITVPAGEPCIPTSGQRGFTVYNTRIRTNMKTGEVTKSRDKTVYEPQPIVKCAPKPPPPAPK